jgi:hypothetical protein
MKTGEKPEMIKQVAFDDVKERDSVLIGTGNNTYRFSMIDSVERKGTLTGGRLGDGLYQAIAFGSISGGGGTCDRDFAGLRTAARAVFCINNPPNGLERFITSRVIDLVHVRNNQR